MNDITTEFQGKFAGKMAFCSVVSNVTNLYLTTVKKSDGQHGWLYIPCMNAPAITEKEKFILYLYPDGYYRIQSRDPRPGALPSEDLKRWLSLYEPAEFLQYDVISKAAAFKIEGNPFGSRLSVKTANADKPLFYMIGGRQTPNILGTTGGQ